MEREIRFQSTPARSGRRTWSHRRNRPWAVSIHARAKRATESQPPHKWRAPVSIHARAKRATHGCDGTGGRGRFQSTPARSGRHCHARSTRPLRRVSIHARAKRATYEANREAFKKKVSIHARAKRATRSGCAFRRGDVFQSTPARSGRLDRIWRCFHGDLFQSTPARSGRHLAVVGASGEVTFQSTPARSGRPKAVRR